ncbi:MAG: ComEC/Rec2 family competence protein [Spirochaetaceae bacterium]|jgi:competence protein ComEC|nr:ComEC/Rec2 family competence protein [Spirochaetaceae bacterium]
MDKLFSLNTILCAALGAVFSYYGIAPLILKYHDIRLFFVIFILLSGLSALCKTLSTLPDSLLFSRLNAREISHSDEFRYQTKRLSLFLVFFTGGLLIGISTRGEAFREGRISAGLPVQEITGITGVLLEDPRTSSTGRGMGLMRLTHSAGKDGSRVSSKGKILVFFPEGSIPRLKEFGRGSTIYVDGNFVESKKNTAETSIFRAGSSHIIKGPSKLDRIRTHTRLALIGVFSGEGDADKKARPAGNKAWGGLALALLLGIRDNLDSKLAAQYQNAGCSYILALSGMHLAIISSIITFLLKKPLGLKISTVVCAVFTILYVTLVGAQPSLVRSALMYLIGALTILFSWRKDAVRLLAVSFIVQLVIDSSSGESISFILSYLALLGILVLGQRIAELSRGIIPTFLSEPLSASLGAFFATISITEYFFASLRPIGIIAGLVMVPLTTVFMIASIIYLAAFFFPVPITAPLETCLSLLYKALEKTAYLAGKAPELTIIDPSFFIVLGIIMPFVLLSVCRHRLKLRQKIRRISV